MKSCEDYFELISARLDGALSPEDTAALDAHLAVCPECRLLAADLAELHSALPTLSAAPPADLIPNVMARIHAENAKVLPFPAPAKRGLHRRAFGSIAAVLAVVVLGASLSHFGAPSAPAPILAVNPTQESGAPAARNLPAPEVSPEPTPAVTVPVQALPQSPAAPPAPVERAAPVPVQSAAPVPVENTAPVPVQNTAPAPVQAPQQSNQENAGPLLNAAPLSTPADACERLFEQSDFQAYRSTACFCSDEHFLGYQLTPPIPAEDGSFCSIDLLEYTGLSENRQYFLFRLCTVSVPNDSAAGRTITELAHYAVPLDKSADLRAEQDDPDGFLAAISN